MVGGVSCSVQVSLVLESVVLGTRLISSFALRGNGVGPLSPLLYLLILRPLPGQRGVVCRGRVSWLQGAVLDERSGWAVVGVCQGDVNTHAETSRKI